MKILEKIKFGEIKKMNSHDDHHEMQKLKILCQKIAEQGLDDNSKEIKIILSQINLEEIIILKHMSYIMKISPQNVEIIHKNSENFKILREACEFYEEIIECSEIKQQNFINILVLNHLLTNLTLSNVPLYCIYSNLFIIDMDLTSFYQIIITHCYGRPNSIYELSLFVKEFNEFQGNGKLIKETIFKYKSYFGKWEIQTFEYFLKYFKVIENNQTERSKIIQKISKNKKTLTQIFEQVKSKEVFDPIYKCILIDDVDQFRNFQSRSYFDIDGYVKNSNQTNNYWPFGKLNKIKYIDLAAFCGSVKIFKLLILNHAEKTDFLINYAIAGGNLEIIHICDQKKCIITEQSLEIAIRYYRNEVLTWLIENNRDIYENHVDSLLEQSILHSNAKALIILFENGCNLTKLRPASFHLYEREWMNFFLTDKSLNEFMMKKLILSKNKEYFNDYDVYHYESEYDPPVDSYFSPANCFPLIYYFQMTNDLNKYSNDEKLIFAPFPNKLILYYLMSYSNLYWKEYVVSNMFSIPYLLFLIEKEVVVFDIKVDKMCRSAIYNNDIEFLYELSKYDQGVSKFVFNYVLRNNDYTNAIINKSKQLMKFFFDKCLNDIECNRKLQTELLITACFFGNNFAVEHLIHRTFIDINSRQFKDGRSPFVLAAESNFVFIVDFLLHDDRIDVNSFDNEHKTAFYYACQYNYIEIVDLLLQNKKVDINIADKEGKTPFCCMREWIS